MWPEKDTAYVKLEEDDTGLHYGLFLNDVLTSVVSLFVKGEEAQFRKFATLTAKQGQGCGSVLLKHVIAVASELTVKTLWCNARADKAGFYKRFGLQKTNKTFTKGGMAYVKMEKDLTQG
ncbi:GNAT family N-acetyltransferase [Pontibacter silvestris]|uniref:GNAT family N-acetyltransferase n=1 Tax=Pontibacter silvestris TaxID=2305183 RepID=A0ABW4X2T4_9BACT|nr:GNAT family N-acetyltransferase [Pontibacter silvestris]MCC9135083.1 GNAT family N-acetyltransferase [Pontibacter silvestris]